MDDTDLRDALERAIDTGPPLPAPTDRLPAARAALRRRRFVVTSVTAAAAVAVVVPIAALAGGATTSGTDVGPMAPPTSQAPAGRASGPAHPWRGDPVAARVDEVTHELQIRPGAVVHERRDDLYPGKRTHSVALDLTWRGKRSWIVLEWGAGGAGGVYSGPGDDWATSFDEFVAQQVDGGGTTPRGRRAERSPGPGAVEPEAGRR